LSLYKISLLISPFTKGGLRGIFTKVRVEKGVVKEGDLYKKDFKQKSGF